VLADEEMEASLQESGMQCFQSAALNTSSPPSSVCLDNSSSGLQTHAINEEEEEEEQLLSYLTWTF